MIEKNTKSAMEVTALFERRLE